MKKAVFFAIPGLLTVALSGCGATDNQTHSVGTTVVAPAAGVRPANTVTFFQNSSSPAIEIPLKPDPLVGRSFSNVHPPSKGVQVYLPIYPGAVSTAPVSGIGDVGRAMDADLVDGIVYFRSKNSQTKILNWYKQQLGRLGYSIGVQGSSSKYGKTTSEYFDFTKHKTIPGNPTQFPEINVGFLAQRQSGDTVFKLMASYIVVPPRPKNSYLPTDVVRVVLTEGKTTKTMTDAKLIANVISEINSLQVETPSVQAGGTAITTPLVNIVAKFYEQNGTVISATFSPYFGTLTIHGTTLNSGSAPALQSTLTSQFRSQGN
ncbi:hypothetical protein [Alicyclobacillus sp. ALC3]|uniref:hypothetical protein n=1 Tax=Alicyclobacillus sp. ALC3 TaxID=2796143 RepID=UPI002378D65E|nr:hypothetical protein [Alicyclobacillus sp. ALC3]WDL96428.1 hypothetical protein JC200_19195 [Alicyclobacillus sp. ALC3]